MRALFAARACLRRRQAAPDGIEGASHRAIGVLVGAALVGVVPDDDFVAGEHQLDAHAVVVAMAMMVVRRVDEHSQRLNAIVDAPELCGARG